ncbi:hypothetical protein KUTeg_006992 [Tegillarca granosa]|uniref:Uncharacterized protein n=1 Tax=Tegillarca granosa TaxID=220873 RepID=A0ABQ9FBY3_TEGGR|nr:hypothetical protein KUTeg_006992 [Tegillarca granosa]
MLTTLLYVTHRVPRNPENIYQSTMPQPIIVSFSRVRDRNAMLKAARNIKRDTKASVRTDIPQYLKTKRSKLAQLAYQLRKNQQLKTAIRETRHDVWLEPEGQIEIFGKSILCFLVSKEESLYDRIKYHPCDLGLYTSSLKYHHHLDEFLISKLHSVHLSSTQYCDLLANNQHCEHEHLRFVTSEGNASGSESYSSLNTKLNVFSKLYEQKHKHPKNFVVAYLNINSIRYKFTGNQRPS